MVKVVERAYEPAFQANLVSSGIHPALARVLAARGIAQASQL